jgi:hypothetical protein
MADAVIPAPVPTEQLNPGEVTKGGNPAPVDPGNKVPDPKPVEQTKEQIAAAKAAADQKTLDDAKAIADAKAAEDAKVKEGWQKEYVKMDNPDAQAAIDLMSEAGVSPIEANAIFAKAIESKKLEDIDWPTLEAKIGAQKARLVKNGIERYFDEVVSVQVAVTEKAYETMGGQENWVKVRDWAQKVEKTDPKFAVKVAEYRKMIETGGLSADTAVKALKADYEADPKNGGLGQNTVLRGDTNAVTTGSPLSRQDYNQELHKAYARRAKPAEIEALHNRRRLGMAQKI